MQTCICGLHSPPRRANHMTLGAAKYCHFRDGNAKRDASRRYLRSTFPPGGTSSPPRQLLPLFHEQPATNPTSRMAATVLGKRQRTAIDLEGNCPPYHNLVVSSFVADWRPESLPLRSGSKRRARTPRIHEEEPPSIRLRSRAVVVDSGNQINAKNSSVGNTGSKRNVPNNNNTLSPSKSDAQLKPTKPLDSMSTHPANMLQSLN